MTFLRNVLRDLVEKRLWPIAVALVAALAAVPVVLGGGSAAPAPAPTSSGAATASVSDPAAAIAVADGPVQQRSRPGRLHDPFVQPKTAKPATPSTATAAATATPAATPGGGTATGGWTPPAVSTPPAVPPGGTTGAGTPAAPKPPERAVYSIDLRFGRTDAMRTVTDVARLTPLPSIDFPFIVFLGVLDDRKTATFLISSDVVPTGDGVCRPSKAQCDTLELKAGDTEFLDRTRPDGSVVQYQMELVRVHKAGATATEAVAAYARKSIAGQELVRTMAVSEGSAALKAYHYRPADGLLVRAARTKSRGNARAASATPQYLFRHGEVPVFRSLPRAPR